jgi:hypothetical protein
MKTSQIMLCSDVVTNIVQKQMAEGALRLWREPTDIDVTTRLSGGEHLGIGDIWTLVCKRRSQHIADPVTIVGIEMVD